MLYHYIHAPVNSVSRSTIYNSQAIDEPRYSYPSTDKWIKKMWFIYTIGFYLAIKKKKLCGLQENK
jgi:hypothetical protein